MIDQNRPHPPFVMTRLVPIAEAGRTFDIAYWQRQGPKAIFDAAWQMVLEAHDEAPMADSPSHFKDLLAAFARYGVRYLVVGGHAVMLRVLGRTSLD